MLIVPAFAKVNLALEVVRRRPDGWHDIVAVTVVIDWHDLIGVRAHDAEAGGPAVAFAVCGPQAGAVPHGDDNLAVRAAQALLARAHPAALELWLDKRVPAAAGLGGGSADAAAVLRAGSALLGLDPADVAPAAAALGSDVPALLHGGAVLASGRGERLEALPGAALHLTVAVAGSSSTAAAYAECRPEEHSDGARARRVAEALRDGRTPAPDDLGSALEPAAGRLSPGLVARLAELRQATPGHAWQMTGSGGAAFALASGGAEAETLATSARALGIPARACRTPVAPPPAPWAAALAEGADPLTYNPGT